MKDGFVIVAMFVATDEPAEVVISPALALVLLGREQPDSRSTSSTPRQRSSLALPLARNSRMRSDSP
jgi:hypothetical protein